ncbi:MULTISPECIES: hypothetical protein [unclassified Microcoleus]|uniref:hypothetical protein n=1 Tax=unclassified Microcoleus TaxID=2642155 RepID=UPI002FCEF1C9
MPVPQENSLFVERASCPFIKGLLTIVQHLSNQDFIPDSKKFTVITSVLAFATQHQRLKSSLETYWIYFDNTSALKLR